MTQENNMETEIKLISISREKLEELWDLPLITSLIKKGSEKQRELKSYYYDTPNRRFAKNAIVFRVRSEPEGFIATVKAEKSNSGGLSERLEYNVVLPSEQPEFTGFAQIKFLVDLESLVARDGQVEKLFSVEVQRSQCELLLSEQTTVEMALDIGKIVAGEKEAPVCEVEFELKSGSIQELISFITALSGQLPLYAEEKSKYVRGCELAGESKPEFKLAQIKNLPEQKSFKNSLLAALTKEIGAALYCLSGVMQKEIELQVFASSLKSLRELLLFSAGLLRDNPAKQKLAQIDNLLVLVEKLNCLEELGYLWQKVQKKLHHLSSGSLLQELLAAEKQELEADFFQQVANGSYSAQLFAFWDWLLENPWKNNVEIKAEDYFQTELKRQYEELTHLFTQDKPLELYEKIALWQRTLMLGKAFSGKEIKILHKLSQRMLAFLQNKMVFAQVEQVLMACVKTSASRLLYRDIGIILGYYLKNYSFKEKRWQELQEEFQKAETLLLQTEPFI